MKMMHPDDAGATAVMDAPASAPAESTPAPATSEPQMSRADKFAAMVEKDMDDLFGDAQEPEAVEVVAPTPEAEPAKVEPTPVPTQGQVVLPPELQKEIEELRRFRTDYERTQQEARERSVAAPKQPEPDEATELADYRKRADKAGLKFVDKDGKPLSDDIVRQYRAQREFEMAEYMRAQGLTPEFLKATQQHNERSQKIAETLAVRGLEAGLVEERSGIVTEFGKETWDEYAGDMRGIVEQLAKDGVALDPTGKNGPSLRQVFHDVVGRRALSARKASAAEAAKKTAAGAATEAKRVAANSGTASAVDAAKPGTSPSGQQQKLSRADRFANLVANGRL